MSVQGTILLVEDDAPQRETLAGFLRKRGHTVLEAASAAEAESVSKAAAVELLLTDLRLGGPDGVALLAQLKARHPEIQAIVLTAYGTAADAVRAMKAGAYDFLAKPVNLEHLEVVLERALERAELNRENRKLRDSLQSAGALPEVIGQSAAMAQVRELALRVAASRASVLITGESGTGKEVLARAIHRASPRNKAPFITVNCAALPETLIEAELFGFEKGAFTGATEQKKGRFELADGGTLFLDEVGDIPPAVQVKLLNVLQSGAFERVGGTKTVKVDVRILAATHRNLEARISEGTFREDLYYRLNVVSIVVPPLRDRVEDIPLLAIHLARKHADLSGRPFEGIEPGALERLMRWPFRGNVRELENWMERAVALSEGAMLTESDFPPQLFGAPTETRDQVDQDGLEDEVARLEISRIQAALAASGGNKSAAARSLKLSERGLRYKMGKYGL